MLELVKKDGEGKEKQAMMFIEDHGGRLLRVWVPVPEVKEAAPEELVKTA